MAVITLTSDLGTKDHYVGSVKGVLLSKSPGVQVIDISHDITPFDIKTAGMMLRNTYKDFPKGSIHLVGVDTDGEINYRSIIIRHDGHYFIGPDNGVLSLVLREDHLDAYEITAQDGLSTFPMKEIYAPAAAALAIGQSVEIVGQKVSDIERRETIQPVRQPDRIRGSVVYVDSYGNVITNISKSLFEDVIANRQFVITFSNYDHITEISTHYSDVTPSNALVMFNSNGILEVCINKGDASSLLGLNVQDTIQIDFL